MSPAELKALLKKAQKDAANSAAYVALLEAELSTWRQGGRVEKADWITPEKAADPAIHILPPSTARTADSSPASTSRPFTPLNPALESLREENPSRPETPSAISLDKDEREEFLARENELADQLAEKVCVKFG